MAQKLNDIKAKYIELTYEQLVRVKIDLQAELTMLNANDIKSLRVVNRQKDLRLKNIAVDALLAQKKAVLKQDTAQLQIVTRQYIARTLANYGIYNEQLIGQMSSQLKANSLMVLPNRPTPIEDKVTKGSLTKIFEQIFSRK